MYPVVVVYSYTGAYVLIVSRLASGICLSEVGKKFEIQREEEGLSVRCCFVQVMPVLLLLLRTTTRVMLFCVQARLKRSFTSRCWLLRRDNK